MQQKMALEKLGQSKKEGERGYIEPRREDQRQISL